MNNDITNENNFENEIENCLIQSGYIKGSTDDYNKEYAIDTKIFFDFIQTSQPKEWQKIVRKHGDRAKENFLKRLSTELANKGSLKILREGVRDAPMKFDLMYKRPSSYMNKTVVENYAQNKLSITRQVHYSNKNKHKSIDIVLFINGIPFATIELKNGFNLKYEDAINQYKADREPNEIIFKQMALVHFAVDPDEIWMTSKLNGSETIFLPFNKGHDDGKGNPENPNGSKTSYLWEDILQKDSIIDILSRFIHKDKDKIIFPRYHQLDVVRKLINDVSLNGSGQNYLIQHSAGSGKSNSIAWLAHHLQSLHDKDSNAIFDSVIIVTDRTVLDDQLQETVFQFDHEDGVVFKVDKSSKQLEKAILDGSKIIVTTLQKFPFVEISDVVKSVENGNKKFAIIIDEAHSSQSGKSSITLRYALGSKNKTEDDLERELKEFSEEEHKQEERNDAEEEINRQLEKQGKLPNLSFFAFTATPKPKTLEIFGMKDKDKMPVAFHKYTMKQAIEEGFILDILKNYRTYDSYFKLTKKIYDDPQYSKKLANKSIAKYLKLHPHSLIQKTEIMIEHFRTVTKNKIGGKAKAMLVTASRLHAKRYYDTFKKYIDEKGYSKDIKILVAFSGTIKDGDEEFTEVKINEIKENELKEKFHNEYEILIVAEKYQTGFDEPLLHTMFVDKRLAGLKAVQTLSRLNRTHPLKEDTFILDFANNAEDIKIAFEPYYKSTQIDGETDWNLPYNIQSELEEYHIIWTQDVEKFSNIFFTNKDKKNIFSKLNSFIDPAIKRFNTMSEQKKEDFRGLVAKFTRTYAFVTNIISLEDPALHKFYAYTRILQSKLPYRDSKTLNLENELKLEYFRLKESFRGSIELEGDDILSNSKHVGEANIDDPTDFLSEIIKKLNNNFNTNYTDEDKKFIELTYDKLKTNEQIKNQAKSNTKELFELPLRDSVKKVLVELYTQHENFVTPILEKKEILDSFTKYLAEFLYNDINKDAS